MTTCLLPSTQIVLVHVTPLFPHTFQFGQFSDGHHVVSSQGFASKLAGRHYKHALKSRAWSAWRSVIESKWKQRVEKACQVI